MTNLEVLQFMVFWSAIGWVVMLCSVIAIKMGWTDEESRKSLEEVRSDLKHMPIGLVAVILICVSFCWPAAFLPKRK